MGSPTQMFETPPGTQLTYSTAGCTPRQSMEFMVTTPGAKFDTDIRPNFSVAFSSPINGQHDPVIEVLKGMLAEVRTLVFSLGAILLSNDL